MGMFDKLQKGMMGGPLMKKTMDILTAQDSRESGSKLGYELICRGSSGIMPAGMIWLKDGSYYHSPESVLGGASPEKGVTPIEIVGVGEITKNAKLVALEVRYRINGAINSMQVSDGANTLLTIQDKLLNGEYAETSQFGETESSSEDSPKFCGQCGARSKSGTKFCSKCGAPLQ